MFVGCLWSVKVMLDICKKICPVGLSVPLGWRPLAKSEGVLSPNKDEVAAAPLGQPLTSC